MPANREHLSPEKQLQQLLEKFDLTCAMKSSPSRSKRVKLLKKTINDVRNEMSLKRVLPSHYHHCSSSTTPSTSASSSSVPYQPESAKPKEEKLRTNGHFPDDEGMYGSVSPLLGSTFSVLVLSILERRSEVRD